LLLLLLLMKVEILRSLIENGIAKKFDLLKWSRMHCYSANAMERAHMTFEQVRPMVMKLLILEEEEEQQTKERRRRRRTTDEGEETSYDDNSNSNSNNFVYGEIALEAFHDFVCKYAHAAPGTTETRRFYDLGSGTGKATFVAAMTGLFRSASGCEILACLHGIATTIVDDFRELILPLMISEHRKNVDINVRHGDIFASEAIGEWTKCEFVFCNCLTWTDEQMEKLAKAAEEMQIGSIFVTVLLPLPSDFFEVVAEEEVLFSWDGYAPTVVHVRKQRLVNEDEFVRSLEESRLS